MSPNPKALEEKLDPRVKRTRSLILQAFGELLAEKGFEAISVQDITDKAEINRATFYKHFVDKYALLDYTIKERFKQEIEKRALDACHSGREFDPDILSADCPARRKPVDKLALIVLLFNIKEPLTL